MRNLPSLVTLAAFAFLGAFSLSFSDHAEAAPSDGPPTCGVWNQGGWVPSASGTAYSRDSAQDAYQKAIQKLEAALLGDAQASGLTLPDCPTVACIQQQNHFGCDQDVSFDLLDDVTISHDVHEPTNPGDSTIYECTIAHVGTRRAFLGCDVCWHVDSEEL